VPFQQWQQLTEKPHPLHRPTFRSTSWSALAGLCSAGVTLKAIAKVAINSAFLVVVEIHVCFVS
jgi:hypothetical protein